VEALNRLNAAGLIADPEDIRPDSIPHPYAGMITRQLPEPGTIVEEGSNVRLWYSTGFGQNYVDVPSLEGLTIKEAQELLLSRKLRSVVLGAPDQQNIAELPVIRQSHTEGTRVREGSEIRLFVERTDEEEN
jgi:beta-lactam-binding protein with PASTA domain